MLHVLKKLKAFNFVLNSQRGGGWNEMLQGVVMLREAFEMCKVH